MQDGRYLLNVEQLLQAGGGQALFQEVCGRIDGERRQKALRIKNAAAQAASVGAGLLLQKVLADYARERPPEHTEKVKLQCFSVEELLMAVGRTVTEPGYVYGKNGKPYLADHSFQFNLSHSGPYVFCGVSEQEIGVDIQKMQKLKDLSLAKRFFSTEEFRALEECGDEDARRLMFFRLWVRKEAYGKLTGRGLADAVGKDLRTESVMEADRQGNVTEERALAWEEYDVPEGCRIAVCKYGRGFDNMWFDTADKADLRTGW